MSDNELEDKIVENDDGSADIVDKNDGDDEASGDDDFYTENLVIELDEDERENIAIEYVRLIKRDKDARLKHDEQCKKALESTGLTGEAVPAFSGGSVLIHPILAKTSVEFASHAIKEIFPSEGPVRTSIIGKPTRKKTEKAERKRRHMNWQLTRQMPEYQANLEKMLPMQALCGSQYLLMYWWARGKRPKSEYISADKIYLPYHASSFYSSQRMTHEEEMSDMEYDMRVTSKRYNDTDEVSIEEGEQNLGGTPDVGDVSKTERATRKIEGKNPEDEDGEEVRVVFNVYCHMKIDDPQAKGDYAPYIMTINKTTQRMIALYRNWRFEDETKETMHWIIEWPMIPWGNSIYSIGAGHLVGQLARGAGGALRCLLDSGLANTTPTGLKIKSAGLSGQAQPLQIGSLNEIKTNAGLDDIRKSIMSMPFNPPSNVLFQLLGFLVNAAEDTLRSTVAETADQTSNTPVGTQLSRIEQGMIVFSAIHKRLHEAQRRTLEVLHRLNSMYLETEEKPDDVNDSSEDEPLAYKEDYEGPMDVAPVSDPNIFSEQQRFAQNSMILQLSESAPQIYDQKAVHRRLLQSAKIQGIDELIPDPNAPHDENPAAENMKMGMGQPAHAMPMQDHLAHLQTHLDFWQSPAYGQNPAIMPSLAPQLLQHLIQHLIMNYGELMQQHLKKAIQPDFDGDISDLIGDDGEALRELSQAIAAASPVVTKQSADLFQKALPIIQKLQQYVQSIKQPQPLDPSQAAIQTEQMRSQTQIQKAQMEIQAETQQSQAANQTEQQKLQGQQQNDQQKNQTASQKAQMDAVLDIASAQDDANKNRVEILRTHLDNNTALEIARMREESGKGAGNLQNGESLK